MAEGSLREYRSKRNFSETSEPAGKTRPRARKRGLRFVIQKHDARRLHFDFRLEHDGVLKSWAVTRGPSLDPRDKRLAVRVEDHPLDYADFEGTIPEGEYGGGTVMLWDEGTWEPPSDPDEALRKGKLTFTLNGKRLKGAWALIRMPPRGGRKAARENWLLIKERDAEAKARQKPLIDRLTTSVRSGRSMGEIATDREGRQKGRGRQKRRSKAGGQDKQEPAGAAKLPGFIPPQLCTLVDETPGGDGWLHEIKYDGYRLIAAVAGGKTIIYTRRGLDWTDKFPSIARALGDLSCRSALIDGEIAITDETGHTDFGALQAAIGSGAARAGYYVFDLLELDGEDLMARPLIDRKRRLEELLHAGSSGDPLFYSDHVVGHGGRFFRHACDLQLEGIVSKRIDGPYVSGRTRSWLKIKCGMGQEFVIVGWRPSKVRGRPFSSLLLAVREGNRLKYRGRVGSGFGESTLRRLWPELKRRTVKTTSVEGIPGAIRRDVRFVEPELVAEIAFRGWTGDGLVRQGSFKGLRSDKAPAEIVREKPVRTKEVMAARRGSR